MLLGFVLLTVVGLASVVPVLRDWLQQRGMRRRGTPVRGRVVDIDLRSFYSLRETRPIVRYRLGDHEHQAPVGNYIGRLPLGSAVDLLVDPGVPYLCMAARGHATTQTLLIRSAITAAGAAGLVCSIALR